MKCPCQNCNENIEFESEHAGQTASCPHCGMDTILFVPQVGGMFKPKATIPKNEQIKRKPSSLSTNIFAVLVLLLGCACILFATIHDLHESTLENQSAIRGIIYMIEYAAGWILIALSFVLNALAKLINK
jgi:hypothetical protein